MDGIRERIVREIEDFLDEVGMSQRAFGVGVIGDGKLLARIRTGVGVTLTTLENIEKFMAETRRGLQAGAVAGSEASPGEPADSAGMKP